MITIILGIILYITFGVIVGMKQCKARDNNYDDPNPVMTGVLCGIIWPITLTIYIIRAAFFEDWL